MQEWIRRQAMLQNYTVLITRPRHQANKLRSLLEEQKSKVIIFPVIDIVPLALAISQRCVQESDSLIFCSANAVAHSPSWIFKTIAGKEVIAVGPATARVLEQNAIQVIMPNTYSSEGLLALSQLQRVDGKNILVFCGEHPRPLLSESLRNRGARVEILPVYRRVPVTRKTNVSEDLRKQKIDVVVVTSVEGMRNLAHALPHHAYPCLRELPLVVGSQRVACEALTLGFSGPVAIAKNMTDNALCEILLEKFGKRGKE